MLNGVANDIIEDEECRTHIVFTRAAQARARTIEPSLAKFSQFIRIVFSTTAAIFASIFVCA
jgi:hypothetical protein